MIQALQSVPAAAIVGLPI